MPDKAKFKPAGTCRRKLKKSELISPDHAVTAFRCDPENAERDKINTRFWSDTERCPLYTPSVSSIGYAFTYRLPLPAQSLCPSKMLSSCPSVSGSVVSIHQASAPMLNSPLFTRSQ